MGRGAGGSETQAVDYVNELRVRAYGDSTGIITGADLDLDFVLAERARELWWEGHRRTDLIRFGEFGGGDMLWSWKGGAQGGAATAECMNLYPIPDKDLLANPNMEQNTCY